MVSSTSVQSTFILLIFALIAFGNFAAGGGSAERGGSSAENVAQTVVRKTLQKSYGYGEVPATYGDEKPDYSVCSGLPKRNRKACKLVVQIAVEARKAEKRGLLEDDELPPPSQGLGLPYLRKPTKAEEDAQPPPKVVAERYACMNMTCLCPYLGGSSSEPDQCIFGGSDQAGRARRQSGNANPNLGRIVRKEYRMLTDNERARYHAAILQLKRGTGSYEYNRIAYLHFDLRAMPAAHSGPTFLPWHREYLKRYEIGLRAVDPYVSIPYWDSTLDSRLPNPADSIIWSTQFMGTPNANNNGIADGFLANWDTIEGRPIQRQLGEDGELMAEDAVNAMINRPEMENIYAFPSRTGNGACTVPNPNPRNVVELGHNNVHTWIGGDMSALPTAPQDPIFFMHHCFMDYIWEQWRLRWQTRAQRESQFPSDQQVVACSGSTSYRIGETMRPFQDPVVLNRAGLSNDYTDYLYTYAPRPTCRAAGGCGSPNLFCDTTKRTPLCVSKIRPGGNCSPFTRNTEQPCYQSTCTNGRCSAARPRVARSKDSSSPEVVEHSGEKAERGTPQKAHGHSGERGGQSGEKRGQSGEKRGQSGEKGGQSGEKAGDNKRKGYGYGGNNSPTTAEPPKPTTVPADEYTTLAPMYTPPKERVCYDNHECCAVWATKGACKSAPRYMNTWCPGACRYDGCLPQAVKRAAGLDYYSQCKRWSIFHEKYAQAEGWRSYRPNLVLRREKLRNECERNPHWMACNCPQACSKVKRLKEDCSQNMPKDYVLEPVDNS
ncbi:hypothetical protein niasHS_005739 [Heterodera schachtii]|uniref:ShKT domain-containing protein n=2 Tax=Heterodera TaxID=34509 RepID=A0ABD2JZN6_HETSC